MATLTEVAKRAGVSIATVSKVLSNTPYFTEETKQKVMKAVEELGYIPNLAARALSTGKTHIIALVFPYVYDNFSHDPFALHILEGVEAELSEQGYNMLLSTPRLNAEGPDAHYMRLIQSGYLDGIVAFDNVPIASVLEPVRKFKIPSVSIGCGEHDYFVRSDDFDGGQQLMEHVLSLGHTQIAIISVFDDLNLSIEYRVDGLRQVANRHGLDFDQFPMLYGDFSMQSGAECTAQLLDTHSDITAMVCVNDRMAIGAIQELSRRGLQVPQDMTVVGYDDIPLASLFAPTLTTVNQHGPELGRKATQMLIAILNNQNPDSILMPTDLMIRQSSAPFGAGN